MEDLTKRVTELEHKLEMQEIALQTLAELALRQQNQLVTVANTLENIADIFKKLQEKENGN